MSCPPQSSSLPTSNKSEASLFDSKLTFISNIDTDQCASSPVATSVQQDVSPGTKERCRISNSRLPPIPGGVTRQQVIHNELFRRHAPYRSSPKASRLSTQFMKRELQLEQLTQEDEECLNIGLSQTGFAVMYEGFGPMLAAREAARQRLLLTTLEIEEAKRLSMFLDQIQMADDGQLSHANELLRGIKGFFTQHFQAGVEGSKDYLQAIQEKEQETFQMISSQTQHISNLLGRRVTQAHLKASSLQPIDTAGDPSDPQGIYGSEYNSDIDSDESDD